MTLWTLAETMLRNYAPQAAHFWEGPAHCLLVALLYGKCGTVGGYPPETLRGNRAFLCQYLDQAGYDTQGETAHPKLDLKLVPSMLSIWRAGLFIPVFLVEHGHFRTTVSDSPACGEVFSVSSVFL